MMQSDTPDEDETGDISGPQDQNETPPEQAPEAAEAAPELGPLDEELVRDAGENPVGGGAFLGVPIEVTISVGKARPLVGELVKLRRDSVISLDSKVDDPVEIYIGEKLIARGELQEMEGSGGQLGVRLTEVADIGSAA
jgi:flagellar motor switch protein FliN/FliY